MIQTRKLYDSCNGRSAGDQKGGGGEIKNDSVRSCSG